MLTVANLTKYFESVKAVDALSFDLREGEILGLVGPNGAGKTTTLRCLCGILKPDGGMISVGGHDLLRDDLAAKRLLAFVPETPVHYDLLTVREHLQFIAMCYDTMDEYRRMSDDLLARFDLQQKENALIAGLSKGMKQKLAIISAMIHKASIFLCDEPLIGLDPQGQFSLKTELLSLRDQKKSVIISTHLLETAEALCDRFIIMKQGRKIFEGSIEELRSLTGMLSHNLEDLFLHLTSDNRS